MEASSFGESGVWFVVLVVPGFLYIRGFFRGRARLTPDQPLYVLGQAIVATLVLFAGTWWLGARHIVHWAEHSTLDTHAHIGYLFRFLLPALLLAFPLGLLTGAVVERLIESLMTFSARLGEQQRRYDRALAAVREAPPGERAGALARAASTKPTIGSGLLLRFLTALEQRELLDAGNAWSKTWLALRRELRQRADAAFVYVRVRTKQGCDITGAFGDESWAAFAPHPQDLYIESVYRQIDPDDPTSPYARVEDGLGIYIAASESSADRGQRAKLTEVRRDGLPEPQLDHGHGGRTEDFCPH